MAKSKPSLPKNTVVPNHIAMVLDGNRRWARAKGLPAVEGHKKGYEAIYKTAQAARDWGIHTFTAWALSTENWLERPPHEARMILNLARKALEAVRREAQKEGVRFVHLGRKDRLPQDIIKVILDLENKTRNYQKHIFNLALDYGGRDEIIRAVQKIVEKGIDPEKITEKLFAQHLDTGGQPYSNIDLFIRTGGELRTSGLLPFQMDYAEYFFERDHLPDFTSKKLRNAILDYSCRRRRFGGNDAIKHLVFKPEVVANLELNWWRLSKVPEGKPFRDFVIEYLKEQYGFSKAHATRAAKYLIYAVINQDKKEWKKAKYHLKSFYKLIKDHLKLAFEPEIVANLRVKLWQDLVGKEDTRQVGSLTQTAQNLYAEEYRLSNFQAAKAAHLRVLADIERNLALKTGKEAHWRRAEDYLHKYYLALKDRVA